MVAKIRALKDNHTWTFAPLPVHMKPIGVSGFIKLNIGRMVLLRGTKLDWLSKGILKLRG